MAGLEELKRKLQPLFDSANVPSVALTLDPCDSYTVSDDGNVNLLSRSYGVYNINEQGLQKRPAVIGSETETGEKTYRCASHEMHVFGTIGCGASSVVQRAIKVPIHRILALKRINVFEKILYDPSPTPPRGSFSPKFCSFVDACLQKDADARPTAEQLLSHPFIRKYENTGVNLREYVRSVFDPTQKLKEIADMLSVHYYLLFDGPDELWQHMRTFYTENSSFSFSGKDYVGQNDIFTTLSDIRRKLVGRRPPEKIVHVVEKLQCRPHEQDGVAIRASGSFILGNHFLICGDGVQAQGMPGIQEAPPDVDRKRVGTFYEQFIMEPGNSIGSFLIAKQELYILQA